MAEQVESIAGKSQASATARDFTASVGCFLVLTESGKLDGIDRLLIGSDLKAYRLQPADLNLRILSPLVGGVQRSNFVISVSGEGPPRAQYRMKVTMGGKTRIVKAAGSLEEILTRALDNDTLPVLAEKSLKQALAQAGAGTSVDIPLHAITIRKHLPRELSSHLRSLAIAHAKVNAPKASNMRDELVSMRAALRDTVLHEYLMKCIWLHRKSSLLGNLSYGSDGVEFQQFDADSPDITEFLCALEKDEYGDFLLDFREFANVIPTPRRENPWLGPTVHIYRADFRAEHGLEEHYSLYAGFRALSALGAPVLIYEGQNPLLENSTVRFLKVSDRSLHLLQGRILEGSHLEAEVRSFTAQDLVWKN